MDAAALKIRISERVDARAQALDRLALEIHARPELAFEERFASSSLADYLESEKVSVERGAGGVETAFAAEAGSGGPLVAILGEYDALPGIGHGCGHNLMGTAAVRAFLAPRDTLDGVPCPVPVISCPAEERGNGKGQLQYGRAAATLMVRSPDNTSRADLRRRVLACFEGAAVATGTEIRPTWSDVCEVVSTPSSRGVLCRERPDARAHDATAAARGHARVHGYGERDDRDPRYPPVPLDNRRSGAGTFHRVHGCGAGAASARDDAPRRQGARDDGARRVHGAGAPQTRE